MLGRSIQLSDALYEYLLAVGVRENAVLAELRDRTASLPLARMQISAEQGQFMQWLVSTIGAKKTIEVGVFTGYSSLVTALVLPPDGYIVACDISEEFTSIAREYWKKAGVDNRIRLKLQPATDTLEQLIAQGESGSFDFAFIDADKENYEIYYELILKLLRPGGVIAVDNVLWSGRVIDPSADDSSTAALRQFNPKLHKDPRIALSMIPLGDGLTLARKL
jgi:predicted O-methyltransferase YrrM